jgi:hypothetical protein
MVDVGDGVMAPALSEDITHVRWVSTRSVAVETAGQLQFKAVLK